MGNSDGKQDECESEDGNGCDDKPIISGGSSSNSTVEETDQKKPLVRPYVRSKMPRVRWTPNLHLRFLQAVERLGGPNRATPKLVVQLMNVKGLQIHHAKSHLQMFRNRKFSGNGQDILDHRHLQDSGEEQKIFRIQQHQIVQHYHRRNHFGFRYGESRRSAQLAGQHKMHNNINPAGDSCLNRQLADRIGPHHLYSRLVADKMFGLTGTQIHGSFADLTLNPTTGYHRHTAGPHEPKGGGGQVRHSHSGDFSSWEYSRNVRAGLKDVWDELKAKKQKLSSAAPLKIGIDLSLSLGVRAEIDEPYLQGEGVKKGKLGSEEESSSSDISSDDLSLSLYSAASNTKPETVLTRATGSMPREGDSSSTEEGMMSEYQYNSWSSKVMRASTLDLTL